ncbi:MAG: CopG family transcriptional regulator [Candidatus Lokiarchaeota archaeon]|nr:CopG family transcriptional regulator [Candidatus Lokiarchaeota archaeon]
MSRGTNSNSSVLTIRIDQDLNEHIEKLKSRLGMSKADIIRNFLELSKYLIKQKNSLKSLNDRDFIIVKRSYLRKLIESSDELEQILLGDKLARFVIDIARISGKVDDLNYKLDICDNLGFFPKFIDEDNYVLVTKKFGPKKFVEAFLFRFFNNKEMDNNYTEENTKGNKSLTQKYKNDFKVVQRSESHFSYEFTTLNQN